MSHMAFVELKIDPKYHRHIIGRSGANGMFIIDSHSSSLARIALLPLSGVFQCILL